MMGPSEPCAGYQQARRTSQFWKDEKLAADAEIERLRAALVGAVDAIRTWHNMGMSGTQASAMWDIYWRNAPEMRAIREALKGAGNGK
jgi:hypothetical protein